jgi:hypothetical protein
MVNAWNVSELDEMVLPPCHYGFQVYTRPTTREEKIVNPGKYRAISLSWNQRSVDVFLGLPFNIASYGLLLEMIAREVNMVPEHLIGHLGDTHLYSNHIEQAKEQIGRRLTFDERYTMYTGHDKTWEEGGGNAYGKINGLDMMDDKGNKLQYTAPQRKRESKAKTNQRILLVEKKRNNIIEKESNLIIFICIPISIFPSFQIFFIPAYI